MGSSPFFSSHGEIYGLVHVGKQPDHEICGEKGLKNTMGKKGHDLRNDLNVFWFCQEHEKDKNQY